MVGIHYDTHWHVCNRWWESAVTRTNTRAIDGGNPLWRMDWLDLLAVQGTLRSLLGACNYELFKEESIMVFPSSRQKGIIVLYPFYENLIVIVIRYTSWMGVQTAFWLKSGSENVDSGAHSAVRRWGMQGTCNKHSVTLWKDDVTDIPSSKIESCLLKARQG